MAHIVATISNSPGNQETRVQSGPVVKTINLPAKPEGGSDFNGGEMLCLALATCYCNDLYREAAVRKIAINSVTVEASADFERIGEAGSNFRYLVSVDGAASRAVLEELVRHTDTVAEIQKTIRRGVEIAFIPGPFKTTASDPA